MAKAKISVIRGFSTFDASGVVGAAAGDEIEVREFTAKRLIKGGFARKWRPPKDKEKENELWQIEEVK